MKSVVIALLLVPSVAVADRVAAITPEEDPPEPVPEQDAAVDAIIERADRAAASRGLFVGTALTVPSGHAELGVAAGTLGMRTQIALGVTPTTELWVDTGRVFDNDSDDALRTYAGGIKQVFGRGETWQAAVTGALRKLGDLGEGGGALNVLSMGMTVTACSSDGGIVFSGSIGVLTGGDVVAPMASLQVSAGLPSVRLQGEAMAIAGAGFAFGGLRFAERAFALDLGALTVSDQGDDDRSWFPFGAVTARL